MWRRSLSSCRPGQIHDRCLSLPRAVAEGNFEISGGGGSGNCQRNGQPCSSISMVLLLHGLDSTYVALGTARKPKVPFAGAAKPGSQPSNLRLSCSFSKIRIHRPPGFETPPELQPAHCPQHNGNSGNDFRRHARSQTLCRQSKRDVTTRPATHLPVPISHTTLAPLGLSHRPGLSSVWTA